MMRIIYADCSLVLFKFVSLVLLYNDNFSFNNIQHSEYNHCTKIMDKNRKKTEINLSIQKIEGVTIEL